MNRKTLILALAALLLLVSLFFSDSLKNTIHRRQTLKRTIKESEDIQRKTDDVKQQLADIREHPESHEDLVRRDLGYIRRGEKEIRFIKAPPASGIKNSSDN